MTPLKLSEVRCTVLAMTVQTPPAVDLVDAALAIGDRVVDLATRSLVVAVIPSPVWARESEVLAAVRAAADAGADVAEVPAEPRLLGPAAAAGLLPIAAHVGTVTVARAATGAGARLLLTSTDSEVAAPGVLDDEGVAPLIRLGRSAQEVQTARSQMSGAFSGSGDETVVGLDTLHLSGIDIIAEASLALSVGARVVRTRDVRRSRRVVEVMAALLEARR